MKLEFERVIAILHCLENCTGKGYGNVAKENNA
jgi:hypothetical protein